ncbi:hypothetical protein D3C85_1307990 [compost metagenome]
MNDVVKTVEIGVNNAVPVIFTERRECAIARNPCIADHAVPCAVRLDLLLQHLATLFTVADVKREQAALTARLLDGVQRSLRAFCIAVVMHAHDKPVSGELSGDGTSDAFAGSGNQNGTIHVEDP